MCQCLQGLQAVFNDEIAVVEGYRRVIDHGNGCPFFEGLGCKTVAVERGSAQGKKERPRCNAPGVGRYNGML